MQENNEWIYSSSEYNYLRIRELDSLPRFKDFDEFWKEFNKNSFLVSDGNAQIDDDFKNKLKNNAVEIYNTFNQDIKNA